MCTFDIYILDLDSESRWQEEPCIHEFINQSINRSISILVVQFRLDCLTSHLYYSVCISFLKFVPDDPRFSPMHHVGKVRGNTPRRSRSHLQKPLPATPHLPNKDQNTGTNPSREGGNLLDTHTALDEYKLCRFVEPWQRRLVSLVSLVTNEIRSWLDGRCNGGHGWMR